MKMIGTMPTLRGRATGWWRSDCTFSWLTGPTTLR